MFDQQPVTAVATGRLRAIARWPVKSLGGEYLDAADVDAGGVAGDRRHTVVDVATGKTLTATETPRLLRWTAASGALRDPHGREWAPGDAATCLDSEPFAETAWTGRNLRIGEAEFELLQPCDRCVIAARDPDTGEKWPELLRHLSRRHRLLFGIFAAPRTAGRVRAGDQVEVGAGAVLSTNNSALAGPTRR